MENMSKEMENLFMALSKGYSECAQAQMEEVKKLSTNICLTKNVEISNMQFQRHEENARIFRSHINGLDILHQQYMEQLNLRKHLDIRGGSVLARSHRFHLKSEIQQLSQSLGQMEIELQTLMGRLKVEIKGIIGFARLVSGDVFEVQMKHGSQKWKSRGRTQSDKCQKWSEIFTIFNCMVETSLQIKISEVHIFGKLKILIEQSVDPCRLFSSKSQLVTINLNSIGSIKLQLITTWIPLMTAIAKYRKDDKDLLKNGNFEIYTRHIPFYYYDPLSRSVNSPKFPIKSASSTTLNLSTIPNITELLLLIDQIRPIIDRLLSSYSLMTSLHSCLYDWEKLLEPNFGQCSTISRNSSLRQNINNELDDNITISENDSGIDSLRQHNSPLNTCRNRVRTGPLERRFKHIKEQRRKSMGNLDSNCPVFARNEDEINHCLFHHLRRCLSLLKSLLCIRGPLEYKEQQLLSKIKQEIASLTALFNTANSIADISNVLTDLGAGLDLQDVWLSAIYPENSLLILRGNALRMQLRNFYGYIIVDRYPHLVENVMDILMSLMNEVSANSDWITVYQFVGVFRDRKLKPYIESLAHEVWITAAFESRNHSQMQLVLDRLCRVPVIPPMESLRQIGLLLVCNDGKFHRQIERYFDMTPTRIYKDIIISFICLLEHDADDSRTGACRALALLKADEAVQSLIFVSRCDSSQIIRDEARKALMAIENSQGFEITKV